jgi:hypothetical protein
MPAIGRRMVSRGWALLAFAVLAVSPRSGGAQARGFEGLAVLANAPGIETLSRVEVVQLMRGERALWGGGIAVTVVLPSARSPLIERVARDVFGLSKTGLQRYWLSLVFQGRATPPAQFESAEEMVAFVRRTPGAIAVVPAPVPEAAQSLVIRVR